MLDEPIRVKKDTRVRTRGPRIVNQPMDRIVPQYALSEIEIETYTQGHTSASLWTAIASGAFALLGGCVWDMIPSDPISKTQYGFAGLLAVVAVFSLFVRAAYTKKRKNLLTTIKEQARAQ